MSKSDRPASPPNPGNLEKGYQPKVRTRGYKPSPQRGHQPTTNQGVPANPPSNPPNQKTSGKKSE